MVTLYICESVRRNDFLRGNGFDTMKARAFCIMGFPYPWSDKASPPSTIFRCRRCDNGHSGHAYENAALDLSYASFRACGSKGAGNWPLLSSREKENPCEHMKPLSIRFYIRNSSSVPLPLQDKTWHPWTHSGRLENRGVPKSSPPPLALVFMSFSPLPAGRVLALRSPVGDLHDRPVFRSAHEKYPSFLLPASEYGRSTRHKDGRDI